MIASGFEDPIMLWSTPSLDVRDGAMGFDGGVRQEWHSRHEMEEQTVVGSVFQIEVCRRPVLAFARQGQKWAGKIMDVSDIRVVPRRSKTVIGSHKKTSPMEFVPPLIWRTW